MPEAPVVAPFTATTYGHGAAPALGQHVVVATFSITARPPLIAFFAFGKDAAEAARLRLDTRRWLARRGFRIIRIAGGGADGNLAWFAIGSMPDTQKSELAACLVQARG